MNQSAVSRRTWLRRSGGILAVVVVFFSLDRIGADLLGSMVLKSSFRYSQLYSGRVNSDALVLGNSRGTCSIDIPALQASTSKRWFNLSYNGLGAEELLELFRDQLRLGAKPKLLLVEASCLGGDAALPNLISFWQYSPGLKAQASSKSPYTVDATKLTHLYQYNSEMTYRALYGLLREDQNYRNKRTVSDTIVDSELRDPTEVNLTMPTAENMAPICELISLARDHGIHVHIYLAPYLPAYASRIRNLDDWIRAYRSYIGDTPFCDLSRVISDSANFGDRIHCNWRAIPDINAQFMACGVTKALSD
jgi:hypothetical protein